MTKIPSRIVLREGEDLRWSGLDEEDMLIFLLCKDWELNTLLSIFKYGSCSVNMKKY
jgi:hypothetical protein